MVSSKREKESPRTWRMALIIITSATILAINLITPMAIPPPINPYHIRLTDVFSASISLIDPFAGACGSVLGHFLYDLFTLGLPGAIPSLFAAWCYYLYGRIVKYRGKITAGRIILGMIICILWLSVELSLGFSLIFSIPFLPLFLTTLVSISVNVVIGNVILLMLLPHIKHYINAELELRRFW